MVKLNKIYTRTGDDGSTGLVDGSRASKAGLRLTAIGEVDEANSCIGVAIAALGQRQLGQDLRMVQNEMFDLGADLATPDGIEGALRITADQVARIEREIDAMNADLSPLTSFILPGGSAAVASLHVARAVVRRAERAAACADGGGSGQRPGGRVPQPTVGPFVRRRALGGGIEEATCYGNPARPGASSRPGRERLKSTRALTLALAEPLSDADATIQPHPDASPAKWHLAHTTWFLETFVLRDHVPGYTLHDERWPFLFNSYYNGEGERHERGGADDQPASLDEIRDWRGAMDDALNAALPGLPEEALALVAIGIQHEQQHQELFLTDILATFAENPTEPAYGELPPAPCHATEPLSWLPGREGIVEIGASGDGFAFDCERPRHRALLGGHVIANRCVTNGEWQQFIVDGGYGDPNLWLSEGWDWVQANRIERPLYWHDDGSHFTLAGRRSIDAAAPVSMVNYYEADAFARWAARGCRPKPSGKRCSKRPTPTSATSSTTHRPCSRDRAAGRSATFGSGRLAPTCPSGLHPEGRHGRRI